jgi:hypothetical protein
LNGGSNASCSKTNAACAQQHYLFNLNLFPLY